MSHPMRTRSLCRTKLTALRLWWNFLRAGRFKQIATVLSMMLCLIGALGLLAAIAQKGLWDWIVWGFILFIAYRYMAKPLIRALFYGSAPKGMFDE